VCVCVRARCVCMCVYVCVVCVRVCVFCVCVCVRARACANARVLVNKQSKATKAAGLTPFSSCFYDLLINQQTYPLLIQQDSSSKLKVQNFPVKSNHINIFKLGTNYGRRFYQFAACGAQAWRRRCVCVCLCLVLSKHS